MVVQNLATPKYYRTCLLQKSKDPDGSGAMADEGRTPRTLRPIHRQGNKRCRQTETKSTLSIPFYKEISKMAFILQVVETSTTP